MTVKKLLMPHKVDGRCMETSPRFIQGPLHSSELAYHHSGDRAGVALSPCILVIWCTQLVVLWQPVHSTSRGCKGTFSVGQCAPLLRMRPQFLLPQSSAWTRCEISEAHSTLHELCCCIAQPGMKHRMHSQNKLLVPFFFFRKSPSKAVNFAV
jgi:hypothetical protein